MQGSLFESKIVTGAILSECRLFRYRLWRTWDESSPACNFLMLNPSTADEFDNDPTVTKCINYAKAWGHGGIIVTNLFAIRSSDPAALKAARDPVGPHNDGHILDVARSSAIVVAAWGAHPAAEWRAKAVRRLLAGAGVPLHCLSTTKAGHPGHPLFLKGGLVPYIETGGSR